MRTQSITLDGNKLKEIANRNPTANITALALAVRERIRNASDIPRTRAQLMREGNPIVESDYTQFWKELQDAGVGQLILGRRGQPAKFAWHFSLKAVSKAMIEGTNETVQRTGKAAKETSAPVAVSDAVEMLTQKVTFELSNNRIVEINIPDNFSKAEAEAVAKALQTLAS